MAATGEPTAGGADEAGPVVLVLDDGAEVVVGRLVGQRRDLTLVEDLARLQLAARRLGLSIRLRGPDPELGELLDLVGLAGVIEVSRLALNPDRETEHGEQLGVEEVLPVDDAAV